MAAINSTCLVGGSGVILQESAGCSLGFFCPNNTATNPPEYCPATPECQIERLGGGSCIAQGIYEPIVCSAGYYCPNGGKEMVQCPSGYWCPLGSFEPWKCSPGTICGKGATHKTELIGLIFMLAFDVILLGVTVGVGTYRKGMDMLKRRRRNVGRKAIKSEFSTKPVTPEPGEGILTQSGAVERDTVGSGVIPERNMLGSQDIEIIRTIDNEVKEEPTEVLDEGSGELKKLVESFGRCIDGKHFGLAFDFQELGLTLKTGRQLLADVNGTIERGSMWGVMGPSGAGKTTFMNVLMGKVDKTTGSLFVNGIKKDMKEYKRIIGYVPQDDIVLAELTVRENILHSARVRLPSSWSESMIQDHVDLIISCLSLTHVQNSLVGDSSRPVISGGQRKRVNIGIELAAAPMALFCDEPTSGLDSTAALQVVKLLQAISKLGVTVVSVIHQPRTEIFECLDNILLISDGRPLWQGERESMITYFKSHGFNFRPTSNPADIIMDIISGQGHHHRTRSRENEIQYLISSWQTSQPSRPPPNSSTSEGSEALARTVAKRGAYWHKQVWYCFARSMVQQRRQISGFLLEIFVGAIAGALMGIAIMGTKGHIFQGIYRSPNEVLSSSLEYILVPQIGLLTCLAIGLAGSPSGVKVFGEEKQIYWREAASGHSRSAYYVGKVFSTFFRIALSALHFVALFSLLGTPVMDFGPNYLACLMYFYCIYGLASCVSMITRRENGPLMSVVVSLIVGIFCGYGPSLAQAKRWSLEWFWRACPGTWFTEAYFTENVAPFAYLYNIEHAANETGYTLNKFGMDIGLLVVIGTAYRIIAYLGLIFLQRDRQR